LHGDSGKAELAALDLAGRAAAGLEVTPDDAADLIRGRCRRGRLLRALRHCLRADAGEPEQRDAARLQRRLEDEPRLRRAGERRLRRRGALEVARRAELVV